MPHVKEGIKYKWTPLNGLFINAEEAPNMWKGSPSPHEPKNMCLKELAFTHNLAPDEPRN